ncbi:MAG: Divergent polysaccharide deacetylase [Elusimicrobia bacterium ADurb.Bin231]|nr:MAG: Divergent polysaccharide deacetylase [Elusimicrobia bacterium ADurb.Bin231]
MKDTKKFILILLITVIFIFSVVKYGSEDYVRLSREIDIRINSVLAESGIGDENIVRQLTEERKSGSNKWLEITKEIKITRDAAELFQKLESALSELPVKIDYSEKDSFTVFKEDMIFLRLRVVLSDSKRYFALIIIDDFGISDSMLEDFLKLGIPMTYSILPFEKKTENIINILAEKKEAYFLHQPMEPERFPEINPGSAALLLNMEEKEIKRIFEKNLYSTRSPVGLNNHMGSAFTKDKVKMRELMALVKSKDMIYVDSMTSPYSVAYKIALDMGVPALKNDVFLDNKDEEEYILSRLNVFKDRILQKGLAVAIGHCQKKNLPRALEKAIPEFKKSGIEFLTIEEYMKIQESASSNI